MEKNCLTIFVKREWFYLLNIDLFELMFYQRPSGESSQLWCVVANIIMIVVSSFEVQNSSRIFIDSIITYTYIMLIKLTLFAFYTEYYMQFFLLISVIKLHFEPGSL